MNLYKCVVLFFVMVFIFMTIDVSSLGVDGPVDSLRMNSEQNLVTSSGDPWEVWNRTYGGVAAEEGWMVQHTTDGGFVLIGYTASFGNGSWDIWVVKTDAAGTQQWSKTYGGRRGDFSHAIQQTADGGYIIGATTQSFGAGGDDIWVIKTDASGTIMWQKTFGGVNQDHCNGIVQLPSGEYVLVGDWDLGGTYDLCVMKLDATGNLLWRKVYSDEHFGFGHAIQMTADGGFIIIGGINLYADSDLWLVKTDMNGTMIWEKTFGGRTPEVATAVLQTRDGGFLLGGWILPADLNKSIVVIKTDSQGNLVWGDQIAAGHSKEEYVNTLGLVETSDGGCIVAGEVIVSNDKDAWVMKIDEKGIVLWDMNFGSGADEYGCGVEEIDEDYVIVVGSTQSFGVGGNDMWLIKVSLGKEDLPPNTPSRSGPSSGKVHTEYPYSSCTTDPEGQQIFYWFDWADGTNSGWLGPYDSGEACTAVHTWTVKGEYAIKVKAKDTSGVESDWSDPLPITMPCSYYPFEQFLELLFQRVPHAFPLLQQLMGH